jgi:hypothetical protein
VTRAPDSYRWARTGGTSVFHFSSLFEEGGEAVQKEHGQSPLFMQSSRFHLCLEFTLLDADAGSPVRGVLAGFVTRKAVFREPFPLGALSLALQRCISKTL